jgi:hypothetical protein
MSGWRTGSVFIWQNRAKKLKGAPKLRGALNLFGAPSGMEWRTVSAFDASPQVPKGMK